MATNSQVTALQREVATLREELDTTRSRIVALHGKCPSDCGSSICWCAWPKTGLRTNGPCSCSEVALRRAVSYWKRVALAMPDKETNGNLG